MASADQILKQREISFCSLHPDKDQAATAAALLNDYTGIERVERLSPTLIRVEYRIDHTYLAYIEELLESHGFHLDNQLMCRLKRALVHYTEDTQRTNLGCGKGSSNCTVKVFVSRYQKRDHGCRDERPQHWRKYL